MISDQPGGHIITFYSYKGGVGRSMTLATVAWILASNGKRVMVIDWDLEAPGLHRYFHPFLIDKDLTSSDGLIEFLAEYSYAATSADDGDRNWHVPFTNILRYATSLEWDFPDAGCVDFVPAGRQTASYGTLVNDFSWQVFYERLGGGLFLESVKERVKAEYDYILIDSRTGITEAAGICTIQMPDTLVVCFTFNHQSIVGASKVAASAYTQRQGTDRASTLRLLPVPTRVEVAEKAKLDRVRRFARERFSFVNNDFSPELLEQYWRQTEIPYVPYYAYGEILPVFAEQSSAPYSLLASMERLTGFLTGGEIRSSKSMPEPSRLLVLEQYDAL